MSAPQPTLDLVLIDTTAYLPLRVSPIDCFQASQILEREHYLHRKAPVSFAYGLYRGPRLMGAVTFGTPASRHVQLSVCPSDPSVSIELNRLWVDDELPRNTESWFVSRVLRTLPPRLVFSYADTRYGHYGYVYRALNFHYAGWTDMERKTPRLDYIPVTGGHTRDAYRSGIADKVRRAAKVKYWIATGSRTDRRRLEQICGWPQLDWKVLPPPPDKPVGEPTGSRF